jgi:hypothetical protein
VRLFDTSVLIDARDISSPWHAWAKRQIAEAGASEGAGVNTVVLAEASVRVENRQDFPAQLERLGLTLMPLPLSAAIPAAKAYAVYLDRPKIRRKRSFFEDSYGRFFYRRSRRSGTNGFSNPRSSKNQNVLSSG